MRKYSDDPGGNAPPASVAFTLGPSSLARGWACSVGGTGMALCLALPWPAAWRGIAFVVVLAATLRTACTIGCASGGVPRRVQVTHAGEVRIQQASGPLEAGELCAGSVVLTRLVILRYRPVGKRWCRALVVLPDAVPDAAFRHLRVLLRAG